jgi:hypothetical protein
MLHVMHKRLFWGNSVIFDFVYARSYTWTQRSVQMPNNKFYLNLLKRVGFTMLQGCAIAQAISSLHKDQSSVLGNFIWDSMCWSKWYRSCCFSEFPQSSLANHHYTTAPFSSITALLRQHIITASAFKFGASSLIQHLAGYTAIPCYHTIASLCVHLRTHGMQCHLTFLLFLLFASCCISMTNNGTYIQPSTQQY